MKRLVYSPSVNVYVKSDFGVIDLTDYITECSVQRLIGSASSATVNFRNPKVKAPDGQMRFLFTEHKGPDGKIGPVFHPMDPIIISMTRMRGKPIQVFMGYCDTTPYVQLFSGIAKIDASCTLKRLLHTYWDPGLVFVASFMATYGWAYDPITGTSTMETASKAQNTNTLNDTGIGNLLMAMLNEVGGWEKNDILLQPLPDQAIQKQVGKIFDDLAKSGKQDLKDYVTFLANFVTSAGGGGTSGGGGGGGGGDAVAPATEDVVTKKMDANALPWSTTGKGSQYGSSHKYHYTDSGDDSYGSQPPASGLDPDIPGIAIRRDAGTGSNLNWYVVRAPSGRAAALPQSDWGPNENTGRAVDINTPAAVGVFGYSQAADHSVNFPTDAGEWKMYFCGTGSSGKTRAENIVRKGSL